MAVTEEIRRKVSAEKPTLAIFLKWPGVGRKTAYELHQLLGCFPELDEAAARASKQRAAFIAMGLDELGHVPAGKRAISGVAEIDHAPWPRTPEAVRLEEDGTLTALWTDTEGYGPRAPLVAVVEKTSAPADVQPDHTRVPEVDAYGNPMDGERW